MCSLHVLPTIGSNVTVHVSSINLHSHSAFVEFGGNFNHGQLTKEIYRLMKKEIHIHKERGCKFEGSPGDLCLVKEEKSCHRARILSKCGDKYNLFLIDDGRTLSASNSIVACGQSSFFNLPPMMELFILASVSPLSPENRWSPTASKFLRSLSGKTVCGCVQDVMMPSRIILLDIPSVFKQMHEFGFARKIPCEKFQIVVEDSLHAPRDSVSWSDAPLTNIQPDHASSIEGFHQYLCPELLPGTIETVEVTQVVNPLSIFCKLQVFSYELKKLSKQIQEYYEGTSALMPKLLCDGGPCAAKGSDGMWYRSVLQKCLLSDVAKVFHVDCGVEDFVKLRDIRPLSAKFFRLPVVTYACSMYGIMDKGTGWTAGQINRLKSILLNQVFVGKFEHRSLSDGIYHVTLFGNDNVNINNSFAVQEKCFLKSERASFCSPFEAEGNETHKDVHRYATPKPCLDSFTLAKGSRPTGNELSVTEDSPTDMKSIYRRLHNDPSYQCEGHSVLDEHLFTVGSVVEVNVSYVESDQIFWCQMAGSLSSLKRLMEDIQRRYSCSQFEMPTGSVCVVHHPENGMWYRAQILTPQLMSPVDVRLIDYGQLLKVPLQDLRPIDPEFLNLKRQAFQCRQFNKVSCVSSESTDLNDSAFSDSFDFISSASLNNVAMKCTIRAVMYEPQSTTLNMVDIESLSPHLCSVLFQKEVNSSAVEPLNPPCFLNDTHSDWTHNIKVGAEEKVWITCVKGVDHFYGQFKRNAAMVEKLTKDIQQFCGRTQHTRSHFLPEMMCLARYKDDQWYRGQIKSVSPKITVHFVDYGDLLTVDTSDLLPFPAQHSTIMSVPFQAVQFSLFNVTLEGSTNELNNWFESYATDCTFTATVIGKSPTGELSVELHDGKININANVKKKMNEMQNREHNTKTEANKTSPKLMKHLVREENYNSRLRAEQDSRKASKSADQNSFTGHKMEKVQCTDLAVCAGGLVISQEVEKEMDPNKHVVSPFSKLKDLPSRTLKAGFFSEVYVSHCNSPSSFFVQLACEDHDICSLVDKLNCSQLCESQVEFSQLLPGHLVKAEYPSDGAWYRAVVKNKLDDCTLQVEFIDHGNMATLSVLKVRQLDLQFLKFPRYSIHCCLNVRDDERRREGTGEQMDVFKNTTVTNGERKLLCNFIKENESIWQVNVHDQSVTLVESLLDMEGTLKLKSCNTLQTVCSGGVSPGIYKKPEVSLGQKIEAYVSSLAGPNHFWCQFADSEKLDKISVIAQETGNSAQTNLLQFDHLSQGDPCLGIFPDDNMWYRAQVINKSGGSVSVLFVDYGNESELNQTSVTAIPTSLLETPPQAFLCQLEGFKPTDGCWNDAASGRFTELMVDKLLKVTIENFEKASDLPNCPRYYVQVEYSMVCVNDVMKAYWNDCTTKNCGQMTEEVVPKPVTATEVIMNPTFVNNTWDTPSSYNSSVKCFLEGTDLPPTAIEQGLVSEVYVSHINSPSSFFVQLAKDKSCIISLTEELNSISSSVNSQVQMHYFPLGSLVKAVFPDDGSWYRAVVKETSRKDVHVEFIDFGNEATVPALNVCKLDEQFVQFPRFSIHCCLKTQDQMGMEQETCPLANVLGKVGDTMFCKFVQDDKTVWKVQIAAQKSTLDSLPTEIWDDFSILQHDSPKQEMSFKKPEISVGQTIDAYASCIVGPNSFWCQRSNSEELNKISLIAQETGNSAQTACIQIDQLCTGDPCLALFTDKLWYRAQVIRKSPNGISVLFVDFGNEYDTEPSSVKPLPRNLLESPLQAFLCQLEGFSLSDGAWNSDATEKFWESIVDKPLKLTVANIQNDLDSSSPAYCVRVQSQECVVNEQMKSVWTASVYPNNERHKLPFSCTDTVLVAYKAQSAPENGVHVIPGNSKENIRTSDIRPHSASTFGKQEDQEIMRQNNDLKEEPKSELKFKEEPLTLTDVNAVSGDKPSFVLEKYTSENKDEFSGIDVKSTKSFQNSQLDEPLPCVGMSETTSSCRSAQTLAMQENADVPNAQAGLGERAELDEIFLKRDT